MSFFLVSPTHERVVWPPRSNSGMFRGVHSATEVGLQGEEEEMEQSGGKGGNQEPVSRLIIKLQLEASTVLVQRWTGRMMARDRMLYTYGHFTSETGSMALHEEEMNFKHMILEKIYLLQTHTQNQCSKN